MGMVFIATQARTTWGITMADDDTEVVTST